MTLRALEDGREPGKQTLRDQFKALRMREEAGIKSNNQEDPDIVGEGGAIAGLIGRSTSLGLGIASPQSAQEEVQVVSTPVMSPSSAKGDSTTTINTNLAPGTVSGMTTSATDAATPIDWDFWQTIVNEGPQAVSRTSPEELGVAISSGIPQTIRGVIWQVLAGSKNDDLEAIYRDLRTRGTNQEAKEPPPQQPLPNGQQNGSVKELSVASSKSSIKSGHSTTATSANVGIGSPSPSHELPDPVNSPKLQVQLAAERAKKAKEDAAAVSKLEKMIKRDMGSRTSYSKYTTAAGLQEPLFNVCRAYALFDDAVGYPQGMNFIIMPLLFTMSEEEAFCLLVRLMNKYQLRDLFVHDMPGLHLHLYQFERLLEDLEPALYCHLNRRGVTPRLYATQWFLTLFAYRFPLQLVMRVYDLVLCEGLEGAILKFGMAVIQRNVQTLLAMNDMQALTNFLKEKIFDVYTDATPSSKSILESGFFGSSGGTDTEVYRADLIVQDASSIKLTPEMLARYREEWEEKTKVEKARETELENLRTDTTTKAAQIRSLETRAEKSDAEHIEIANELVKLKVENTELSDQNESLKGQVEELRKVADSEAKNVEDRLRAGTEQVMQRNIEVQNENRHMEEQMTEMEKELVAMKMKYAEVSLLILEPDERY
jgi:Rab-GTPase-TBC domain